VCGRCRRASRMRCASASTGALCLSVTLSLCLCHAVSLSLSLALSLSLSVSLCIPPPHSLLVLMNDGGTGRLCVENALQQLSKDDPALVSLHWFGLQLTNKELLECTLSVFLCLSLTVCLSVSLSQPCYWAHRLTHSVHHSVGRSGECAAHQHHAAAAGAAAP
jgi:hypothetical protein